MAGTLWMDLPDEARHERRVPVLLGFVPDQRKILAGRLPRETKTGKHLISLTLREKQPPSGRGRAPVLQPTEEIRRLHYLSVLCKKSSQRCW